METKLYIGNLSFSTTEDEVRALFAQAGTVTSVELIKDRFTGNSKGFAFVQMSTQAESEKAISMYNGFTLGDREIKVSVARPREERGHSGFGNRPDNRSRGSNRRGGSGGGGGGGGGPRRY